MAPAREQMLSLRRLPGGVGDDNGESEPEREDADDRPVSASEKSELSWLVAGDEGAGISSDSISSESGVGEGSASADGKKLRNRFSAWYFDAFLNSIQTSMRPGRQSAGSS